MLSYSATFKERSLQCGFALRSTAAVACVSVLSSIPVFIQEPNGSFFVCSLGE